MAVLQDDDGSSRLWQLPSKILVKLEKNGMTQQMNWQAQKVKNQNGVRCGNPITASVVPGMHRFLLQLQLSGTATALHSGSSRLSSWHVTLVAHWKGCMGCMCRDCEHGCKQAHFEIVLVPKLEADGACWCPVVALGQGGEEVTVPATTAASSSRTPTSCVSRIASATSKWVCIHSPTAPSCAQLLYRHIPCAAVV
jgi:hypothetical protein